MLGRVGIGADQREHSVRSVRSRSPDLLPVDDEIVTVAHGARGQRGEIGAGAGLAIALRPGHGAVKNRRQVLVLLLVRPVNDERRAKHVNAGSAHCGRAGLRDFLVEDELLHGGQTTAAVFGGPMRSNPVTLGERGMPVDRRLQCDRVVRLAVVLPGALRHRTARREVSVALRQPFTNQCRHFTAKGGLLRGVAPIHGGLQCGFVVMRRSAPRVRVPPARRRLESRRACG